MSEGERVYWGTVRYADESSSLHVVLIGSFRRGGSELAGYPQMSSSSGPKDYLKNQIWDLLDATKADEVYLVRGRGPMFPLIRTGSVLVDIDKRTVILEQEECTPAQ
jgi:hypothetical protein